MTAFWKARAATADFSVDVWLFRIPMEHYRTGTPRKITGSAAQDSALEQLRYGFKNSLLINFFTDCNFFY